MTQARLGSSRFSMMAKTLESECKFCKKMFWHTPEHAYKGCCTWGCLVKLRAKEGEYVERRGAKVIIKTEDQALDRIKKCEERIAYFTARTKNKELDAKAHDTAKRAIWEWKRKLEDAKHILSEMRGAEDE